PASIGLAGAPLAGATPATTQITRRQANIDSRANLRPLVVAEIDMTKRLAGSGTGTPPLLQYLASLCIPEQEIELIEIHANPACEVPQSFLGLQVPAPGRGGLIAIGNAEFEEPSKDMLVQDSISSVTNIAEKVARLLIGEPTNSPIRRKEIT